MTYSIFRGAINAQIFEEFIDRDVLPLCHRYPGPKSIIVMDNAGIHIPEVRSGSIILTFSRISKLSLTKRDAGLEFLPPYSPDFNPIEFSSSVIKCALKGTPEY